MYQIANATAVQEMTSLLSIGDFSELCEVRPSTLRYWDEIGLLTPALRNAENGYRYYSLDQIVVISILQILHSLHIPLRSMLDIGKNPTPEQLRALCQSCDEQLEAKIAEMRANQEMLRSYAALIEDGQAA